MTADAPNITPATRPTGMFRELLAIHAMLRRDLGKVRRLSSEVRDGGEAGDIAAEIRSLESGSPIWQLRFGCLHYCRFVHTHHSIEDTALFPMVRRHDPTLDTMVDRLEADHRAVHGITERIADLAGRLPDDASGEVRRELANAIGDLEARLLAHLALEESTLGPLLGTWDRWPTE